MSRQHTIGIALVTLALAACVGQEAQSDLKSEVQALREESRARQASLESNLAELQKQQEALRRDVENTEKTARQGLADQGVAQEELKVEVQTLRGQMEELDHRLKQQEQARQQDAQLLEQTLKQINQRLEQPAPPAAPAKEEAEAAAAPEGEHEIYTKARQELEAKRYDAALHLFALQLKKFPKGAYADNAQYWLGETYYAKRDFERAIVEMQKVVEHYPHSEKWCAALLKQGYAFLEMGQKPEGEAFLREVQNRCAKSPLAAKAAERLKEKLKHDKGGKK